MAEGNGRFHSGNGQRDVEYVASLEDHVQKKCRIAAERSADKRAAFQAQVATIAPERLVFLDESGFSLSLHRFYGWAARGKRLTEAVPYGRGKNLSLLGALSRVGMLCTRHKEGAMCRDDVEAFLEDDLLPRLPTGSVLVLDNATIHRGGNLAQLAAAAGCVLLYLPPYSPDFNPIEMAWAWMKQRIRHKTPRDEEARKQAVQEAIDALPNHFALNWFNKCRMDQE